MPVSQDATSLKYVPANASECTTLLAGSGINNPFAIWGFQDNNGSVTEALNGTSLSLTKTGFPTYQNSVTGWTRKSIICRNSQNDGFTSNNALLPALASESVLWFGWFSFPAVLSAPSPPFIVTFGDPYTSGQFQVSGAGICKLQGLVNVTSGSGTHDYASTTGYILAQFNRSGSPTTKVVTAAETFTISATISSSTKNIWLGGDNGAESNQGSGIGYMYLAAWKGADAELDASHITTLIDRFNNGPPGSGYSRGRGVNGGGLGTGSSRGRIVNSREAQIASMARKARLPFRREERIAL